MQPVICDKTPLLSVIEGDPKDISFYSTRFFGRSYQNLQGIIEDADSRRSKIKRFFLSLLVTSSTFALTGGALGFIYGFKTTIGLLSSTFGVFSGFVSFTSIITGFCVIKSNDDQVENAVSFLEGAHAGASFLLAFNEFKESLDESKITDLFKKFEAMIACDDCFQMAKGEVRIGSVHLMSFDPLITKEEYEMLGDLGKIWLMDEIAILLIEYNCKSQVALSWKSVLDNLNKDEHFDTNLFWKDLNLTNPTKENYMHFIRQKSNQKMDMQDRIMTIFKTIIQEFNN